MRLQGPALPRSWVQFRMQTALDYLNPARPAAPHAGEGSPGRCWAEPEL